jgi:hypothetical protein
MVAPTLLRYCCCRLLPEESVMSEMPPGLPKHPIGTFAFVGAYAVIFVILWYAIYFFLYLGRSPVTP